MPFDPTDIIVLMTTSGALCLGGGFFLGRMTATPKLVLGPLEEKMQRRRYFIDQQYEELEHDRERSECPLANEDGDIDPEET